MATKLTKAMRQEILDNVMASTNYAALKEDVIKRTSDLVRSIVQKKVPADFIKMIEGKPPEWFAQCTSVYLDRDDSPARAILLDVSDPSRWSNEGREISFEPVAYPLAMDLQITEAELKKIAPLCKEATKIADQFKQIRSEMSSFLASCTTVEKLLERMPELKPHIPEVTKFYAPTVSTNSLLSALMKSGFVVQEEAHV